MRTRKREKKYYSGIMHGEYREVLRLGLRVKKKKALKVLTENDPEGFFFRIGLMTPHEIPKLWSSISVAQW